MLQHELLLWLAISLLFGLLMVCVTFSISPLQLFSFLEDFANDEPYGAKAWVASDDPRKKHEGLKLRRRNNGGETESVSSSASPTEEPLKIKKPKLKIGKIGKTLGSVAKKATGAIAGKKSAENDSGGNGGDEGSVIRIPPQPDFEEVVRQINEQLHNLSKPQIMEIAKKAKEVITEKNDEEQKLEDELNKL